MSRVYNSSLKDRSLSHGDFFKAVRSEGFVLKVRGDDKLVCRDNDLKAQFPVYTVRTGAVLPETALFSSKERKDIGFHFRFLSF